MDAAYLALFRRRPETVAMARRLLELPRPPTAVDLDERGDPIVSPEEEEYFRLSGVLMAAVRGRPEPGIQAVVYQIPGPQLLGRAAVQLIRAFDAATSVVAGIHRPVTDRIVMGRRNRQR